MKSTWKKYLLYGSVIVVVGLFAFIIVQTVRSKNTGFETKTLWDWLELLVIPAVLSIGAYFLNRSERAVDRKIAEDRAKLERELAIDRQQEAALQAYLDKMSELLLKENLRTTENEEIQNVIRIRTLTVLSGLDGKRKGLLLNFLHGAGLISKEKPIVNLEFADLQGADLQHANLSDAVLHRANLKGANLHHAKLKRTNLSAAELQGANLYSAYLQAANLHDAKMQGADLQLAYLSDATLLSANLQNANLWFANLQNANLFAASLSNASLRDVSLYRANLGSAFLIGADLRGAKLVEANLLGAQVSSTQLANTASLKGATMRDGTKHD